MNTKAPHPIATGTPNDSDRIMTKVHRMEFRQIVPVDLETCWDFFSSPANLKVITPSTMRFNILSGGDLPMFPGQIICYRVSPFPGIRVQWVTEITQVQDHVLFIDEQRFGPYRFWHHLHRFNPVPEGTEMIDVVHYALPLGWPGNLSLPLVKRKLRAIFSYRHQKITELFGSA